MKSKLFKNQSEDTEGREMKAFKKEKIKQKTEGPGKEENLLVRCSKEQLRMMRGDGLNVGHLKFKIWRDCIYRSY